MAAGFGQLLEHSILHPLPMNGILVAITVCGQINIGNAATEMTERMTAGVRQADGTKMVEPRMDVRHVAVEKCRGCSRRPCFRAKPPQLWIDERPLGVY